MLAEVAVALAIACLLKWQAPCAAQIEAVASLVNGVGESVLFAALQREEERNPDLSEPERLNKVASRLVPASIPGSPQYHRQALQDLLAIVHAKGLPSFFLTLTGQCSRLIACPLGVLVM